METAIACTALLGLLVFGLGFLVSLTRGQYPDHDRSLERPDRSACTRWSEPTATRPNTRPCWP